MQRRHFVLGLIALGALAVPAVLAGCSLSKAALERRLLDLPKNAPFAARGLVDGTVVWSSPAGARTADARWVEAGPADTTATPVVLVHGTPGSLFTWVEVVEGTAAEPGLAADRRVVAVDLPGHGTTRARAGALTFADAAAFLAAFLRARFDGPVDLVGHSYGGEVAWRAALDAPERVRRLVLVDSSGLPRPADGWLPEEVAMRENPLADLGWLANSEGRVGPALDLHFPDGAPPDRVREMTWICANRTNWEAMVSLARDENGSRADDLARLRPPVLLLWGADDGAYPPERYAQGFADRIPDARLVLLEGCGHYPPEQQPAATVRAIREFLDAE